MATVQPLQAIVVGAPRLVSKLDPTVVAALAVAGIRAAAASAASRTGVDLMARILSDARLPFVLPANGLASSARTIDDRVTIGSRAAMILGAMHASISTFRGDPDDLLARYDAMVAEIPPASIRLHMCLRSDDGIVVVDTCPSREAFDAFFHGGPFRSLLARHGLPDPVVEDHPVHAAIAR
jgi:hypothetical protein